MGKMSVLVSQMVNFPNSHFSGTVSDTSGDAILPCAPFDCELWCRAAAERYPDRLPKPHSNDLTQRLFDGHHLVGPAGEG